MKTTRMLTILVFGLVLGLVAPATNGQNMLSGRVYKGNVGDQSSPLRDITVELYCSGNADQLGSRVTSTSTDALGWYGLIVPLGCEYYNIVLPPLPGYTFVGATTAPGGGTVKDNNWIQYEPPLEGKTLTGNKFWFLSETVPPENQPPEVNAGPDRVLDCPVLPCSLDLAGGGEDVDGPEELTFRWELLESPVPGEVPVEFGDQANPTTRATFFAYGTYHLGLVAFDGELEAFDDVTIEIIEGEYYIPEDLNRDGCVNMYDLTILASAWLECEPRHAPEVVVQAEVSHSKVASVIVPVYMYYLERYFSDVPEKTEIDTEIKSILDESPAGREFLQRAFENYEAMPPETRYEKYDPEVVALAFEATEPLNFDFISERLSEVSPILGPGTGGAPAAPSLLVAQNKSTFEPVEYHIELSWQDNSSDEDGFLIYRALKGTGGKPQFVSSVGPNVTTFVDTLSTPADKDDQYCYAVVAFKYALYAPVGQPPSRMESSPSTTACSYYAPSYPPPAPLPDTDGDGIPDKYDKCPLEHVGKALWTEGCPDLDGDGVPDKDDNCPLVWGEKQDGCPLTYNLRWMGMKILNNTGEYAHSQYNFVPSKGLHANEIYNDNQYGYGEEPYLIFTFTNGMTVKGMLEHGSATWCCGEHVDVKKGEDYEPDNDSFGEKYPLQLNDLRDYGLSVWPAVAGKSAEIDRDLGLSVNITLMERDYKATITVEDQADKFEAAFKIGGVVTGAVAKCVGTGGLGCLLSIGGAIKTVIEEVLGLSQPAKTVTVTDPDDLQGSNFWAITRGEAEWKTSSTGAYPFYFFEMPIPYYKFCPWIPCLAGQGYPTTMRIKPYFCLCREGMSDSDIKKHCAPSKAKPILPWPMKVP